MALPSSRNTSYGTKPRTILSADLNAIQDSIIGLWNGDHGSLSRFYGPWDFQRGFGSGGDGDLSPVAQHRIVAGSSGEFHCPLINYANERIDRVVFYIEPLSTTGVTVRYREDEFTTNGTPVSTTLTSSSTGFQEMVLTPAATIAASRLPYIDVVFNAGSGYNFYGALVEFTRP